MSRSASVLIVAAATFASVTSAHATASSPSRRLGFVSNEQCELAFVNLLNTGGVITEDPNWPGTWVPGEFQPVQMGFIGCAWCLIKCGASMKKAANCADGLKAALERCYDPQVYPDMLDQAKCVRNTRCTYIPNCIAEVARTAGDCGTCVLKCAPKPTL